MLFIYSLPEVNKYQTNLTMVKIPVDIRKYAIAAVVVIVIILIFIQYTTDTYWNQFIVGAWESDSTFNDDAGIKSMRFIIGEPKGNVFLGYSTDCYMHIDADDGVIMSQVAKMTYNSKNSFLSFPSMCNRSYNVDFEFEEESDLLPENLDMEINTMNGNIQLFDEDAVLYASLYKDNASTHLIHLENDSSSDESSSDDEL